MTIRRRLLLACAVWLLPSCWRCRAPRRRRARPQRGAERQPRIATSSLFTHSENCVACHNNLSTPVGRGRLDRRDLALDDDGQLGPRSRTGRPAVRRETIDHPTHARGDSGRVRRLPHADGRRRSRARPGGRARCSRTCRSPARRLRRCIGWRPTASRARSATRSRSERLGTPRELQRRLRDDADAARRRARRSSARTRSTPAARRSCARSPASSRRRRRTSSSRSCAPPATR